MKITKVNTKKLRNIVITGCVLLTTFIPTCSKAAGNYELIDDSKIDGVRFTVDYEGNVKGLWIIDKYGNDLYVDVMDRFNHKIDFDDNLFDVNDIDYNLIENINMKFTYDGTIFSFPAKEKNKKVELNTFLYADEDGEFVSNEAMKDYEVINAYKNVYEKADDMLKFNVKDIEDFVNGRNVKGYLWTLNFEEVGNKYVNDFINIRNNICYSIFYDNDLDACMNYLDLFINKYNDFILSDEYKNLDNESKYIIDKLGNYLCSINYSTKKI